MLKLNLTDRIQNYTAIDLFAGVGGIRLGFAKNGFTTIYANDSEPNCKYTYDLNSDDTELSVADFKTVNYQNIPNFDLLLGGFPCQAF